MIPSWLHEMLLLLLLMLPCRQEGCRKDCSTVLVPELVLVLVLELEQHQRVRPSGLQMSKRTMQAEVQQGLLSHLQEHRNHRGDRRARSVVRVQVLLLLLLRAPQSPQGLLLLQRDRQSCSHCGRHRSCSRTSCQRASAQRCDAAAPQPSGASSQAMPRVTSVQGVPVLLSLVLLLLQSPLQRRCQERKRKRRKTTKPAQVRACGRLQDSGTQGCWP